MIMNVFHTVISSQMTRLYLSSNKGHTFMKKGIRLFMKRFIRIK